MTLAIPGPAANAVPDVIGLPLVVGLVGFGVLVGIAIALALTIGSWRRTR